MALRGWWLVGWTALGVGLLVAVVVGLEGTGREGLGAVLRWTARVSGLLFYAAISASALRTFLDVPATRALLANRRYVGVSAGVAHTWHMAAVAVFLADPQNPLEPLAAVGGGLAWALLLAMMATSFDRSAAWLGARRWKQLHTFGAWYVWFIFTFTFLGSAGRHAGSALLLAVGVGALGLRVAVALRRLRRRELRRKSSAISSGSAAKMESRGSAGRR